MSDFLVVKLPEIIIDIQDTKTVHLCLSILSVWHLIKGQLHENCQVWGELGVEAHLWKVWVQHLLKKFKGSNHLRVYLLDQRASFENKDTFQ